MIHHRYGVMLSALLLATIGFTPAGAQDTTNATDAHQAAIARMLHSRMDFAWLFDPVLLDHIETTEPDAHDARQVVGLARVARSNGLAARADVRAARAAAEDLILAEAERRRLVDSLRPDEAEVARRIAAHPGRYDEYRLRHIFIAVGPTRDGKSRSEAEALALARQVRARIMRGERFETVATAASEDSATAIEGGALSALLGVTMDDAFLPHVATLPVGGVTEPVRGPQGFHILKLDSRQSATPASARYWVEQDILKERLPGLIARTITADGEPNRLLNDPEAPMSKGDDARS